MRKGAILAVLLALTLTATLATTGIPGVQAKPGIAFVGSGVSNVIGSNGVMTVSYRSHSGHFVEIGVQNWPNCPAQSVSDNGGSVYSLIINNTLGGGNSYEAIWATTGTGSIASTSFSIAFKTSPTNCGASPYNTYSSAVVSEYSGAISTLGQTVEFESSGTGASTASCSISPTTLSDMLVTFYTVSNFVSISAGTATTLRNTSGGGFQQGALADSPGSSTSLSTPTTTTLNLNYANPYIWYCGGIELRLT